MILNDLSPMPFGKHKDLPMQDVPAHYLHWLWTSNSKTSSNEKTQAVLDYIETSMTALKDENPDLIWTK
jgi:hypothetical protein